MQGNEEDDAWIGSSSGRSSRAGVTSVTIRNGLDLGGRQDDGVGQPRNE